MKNFLVVILLFCASTITSAQEKDSQKEELIIRPFQLSFITPLGTNGMESGRVVNQLSINLFAGYSAGVDGLEMGGFANLVRCDVKGVQLAGFLNYAGGSTNGLQMAGFSNIVRDSFKGTQSAGFTNMSKNHDGLQMAGFGNFTAQKIEGVQLAGFINVAKEMEGSQIAGFLNISKNLNGIQLGVVNIVDSVESGTPIGIFSFVRNGYNHVEIWASETLNLNAAFKFGTSKFYNILAAGAGFKPINKNNVLAIGYGMGHAFPLSKGQLSLDAISYQLMDSRKPFSSEYGEFNQLSQLKLTYDYPGKNISYFIGPSFNLLLQQNKQSAEEGWLPYAPYALHTRINGDRKTQMWIGGQLGIRF